MRLPATTRVLFTAACLSLCMCGPAQAQGKRERGFITINGGVQRAAERLNDRFTYEVNVEDATTEVAYPSDAAASFDVGAGIRLFRNAGVAVAVSRAMSSGSARTESQIPHPFFDDQHREVVGDAGGIERSETAVHVQLYALRSSGRWRMRLMGGATYFNVEQDVVTGVLVDESFPFDTATFRSATSRRITDSAIGFNAGADLAWMFNPTAGVGGLVRFSRGTVDLNVEDGRRVSTIAGGVQAGAGLRLSF